MIRSWLRFVALAVLLSGLAVWNWHAVTGAAEDRPGADILPPDLARVPVDALAFQSVRVADVWSSPIARGVRARLGKEFTAMIKDVETKYGLAAEDIERATMVLKDPQAPMPLFFFGTKKAFDKKRVFGLAVPGGEEEKYKGESIVANERQAAYVLGDMAFVVGSKADIQSLIEAGKVKPEGPLAPAVALSAQKHSYVGGVNPSALPPISEELPPQFEALKPLLKARLATVTVNLGERTTDDLRITFPGRDEASAALKALQAGRKLALGFLEQGIGTLRK
jgi:hypothetical protein